MHAQLAGSAGEGPASNHRSATISDQRNDAQQQNTRALAPLTDLGTVPNPLTPVPAQPTADDNQNLTEDLSQPLHCNELEKEIASLWEKYALKALEQYTANFRAAVTAGQGPDRLAYSRGPSLKAVAEYPPPKRTRSKDPRPSKLHNVRPPFYEGKN